MKSASELLSTLAATGVPRHVARKTTPNSPSPIFSPNATSSGSISQCSASYTPAGAAGAAVVPAPAPARLGRPGDGGGLVVAMELSAT